MGRTGFRHERRQAHQVHEIALQAERHRHGRIGLQRALEGNSGLAPESDISPYRFVEGARGFAVGGSELQVEAIAMHREYIVPVSEELRHRIRREHRSAEAEAVEGLRALQPGAEASRRITALATQLAERVRAARPGALSAESFLRHYGLSTQEGVALMCVAEALLRIPDPDTADALLREKLREGDWGQAAESSFAASAADWGLMLTGTLARWHDLAGQDF